MMHKKSAFFCLLCFMGLYIMALFSTAWAGAALPDGASSLTETYQDWSVACQVTNGGNSCVVSQRVLSNRPNQFVLQMQLYPEGMHLHGKAILPFGLDLSKGVTLLTDGQDVGDVYSFSTCLPVGCIVPLGLDSGQLDSLEKSKKIEVAVNSMDGKSLKLPVSPKGLANAMKRARALSK